MTEAQYSIQGNRLHPCGRTAQRAPAGFYDVDSDMRGYYLQERSVVSDDLIDIPGTVADVVFDDIESFLSSKERYSRYGLTHKRGYLFHGPPGSGKTSIGLMLARRFIERVGGVVMFVGRPRDLVGGVDVMRTVEPGRPSMYLIEEAEHVANYTECLSILDGELSIQGAVFVAMTNYRDRLPPRLTNRPGRFDRVLKVDCPPESVQVEYLRRVEARVGDDPDAPGRIVEALRGLSISLAHLREAFVSHVLLGMTLGEVRSRFTEMSMGAAEEADGDGPGDDGTRSIEDD